MKKVLFLYCILFMLSACKQGLPTIAPKQMSKILTDLHLADAYAQIVPRDSSETSIKNHDSLKLYYSRIFKQNQVTEEQFKQNMAWYQEHPDILDSVYQMALSDISSSTILKARK